MYYNNRTTFIFFLSIEKTISWLELEAASTNSSSQLHGESSGPQRALLWLGHPLPFGKNCRRHCLLIPSFSFSYPQLTQPLVLEQTILYCKVQGSWAAHYISAQASPVSLFIDNKDRQILSTISGLPMNTCRWKGDTLNHIFQLGSAPTWLCFLSEHFIWGFLL